MPATLPATAVAIGAATDSVADSSHARPSRGDDTVTGSLPPLSKPATVVAVKSMFGSAPLMPCSVTATACADASVPTSTAMPPRTVPMARHSPRRRRAGSAVWAMQRTVTHIRKVYVRTWVQQGYLEGRQHVLCGGRDADRLRGKDHHDVL